MLIEILKSKIHRATVTQADLNYIGSITIDADLMDAAGIMEYEKVLVANCMNGERLETYAIAGDRGSGIICMNGAAAYHFSVGASVIIMCFAQVTPVEAASPDNAPRVVFVDAKNKIERLSRYEKHGRLEDL